MPIVQKSTLFLECSEELWPSNMVTEALNYLQRRMTGEILYSGGVRGIQSSRRLSLRHGGLIGLPADTTNVMGDGRITATLAYRTV